MLGWLAAGPTFKVRKRVRISSLDVAARAWLKSASAAFLLARQGPTSGLENNDA